MRHAIIAVLAGLLLAAPVRSQEPEPQVLYCVDEGVIGFKWDDKGNAEPVQFKEVRFTVNVVSETERSIHWPDDEDAYLYNCVRGYKDALQCSPFNTYFDDLIRPVIFSDNDYTRAFLFADAAVPPNIYVAHGTCSKF